MKKAFKEFNSKVSTENIKETDRELIKNVEFKMKSLQQERGIV